MRACTFVTAGTLSCALAVAFVTGLPQTAHAQGNPLPAPWTSTDIGDVGVAGSSYEYDGDFLVSGAGGDIWGNADAFQFAYQALPGNGTIEVTVRGESQTNFYAKAGIMIRQTTDPSSPHVILDINPSGRVEFMTRSTYGGDTMLVSTASVPVSTSINGMSSFYGPGEVRLKLQSSFQTVYGWISTDSGATWYAMGSEPLPGPALIGLAVTSHDPTTLNNADFGPPAVITGNTNNLLINGGFEDSTPPDPGPGWVADVNRQVLSKSETNQPRSGLKNGACWTTEDLDCGMYQDVVAPATGRYFLESHGASDRQGGWIGVNVNGAFAGSTGVPALGFGVYSSGWMYFDANEGDVIRVWMYSAAVPGYVVMDDMTLTLVQ